MRPGIHYPEDEKYNYPERQTKCPHCSYEHKSDISFYKVCLNCRKSMSKDKKETTNGNNNNS